MNRYGIIYKYQNKVNGKIYIGQTTTSLEERLRGHLRKRKGCKAIDNALHKYGIDNFNISVIDECFSQKELDEKEMYWIKQFNSNNRDYGYNLTAGGEHGSKTEDAKKNMSVSAKKRCTQEWRKKQSDLCKERFKEKANVPFYGKHHTEKTKAILSKKASKRQKGENNPFFNKKHSEESKRKMSETKKGMFEKGKNPAAKKVLCLDTGEVFSCAREASIKYGMHENSLSTIIRRNGKAKGLRFVYTE